MESEADLRSMSSPRAPSRPAAPASFVQRARGAWRGSSIACVIVTGAYALWEPSLPALLSGLGLGICAALLWACSRAALAELPEAPTPERAPAPPVEAQVAELAARAPESAEVLLAEARVKSELAPSDAATEAEQRAREAAPQRTRLGLGAITQAEIAEARGLAASASPAPRDEAAASALRLSLARPRADAIRFGPETDRLLASLASGGEGSEFVGKAQAASGRTLKGVSPVRIEARPTTDKAVDKADRQRVATEPPSLALVRTDRPANAPEKGVLVRELDAEVHAHARLASSMHRSFPELEQLADELARRASEASLVIGVTSTKLAVEAKVAVASQLAHLLAERKCPTLLAECDFEAPALDRQLALAMPPLTGFSQQVFRRMHKTHAAESAPWTVLRYASHLSVLLEGRVRTPGVVNALPFTEAFDAFRQEYRVVLAHLPSAADELGAKIASPVVNTLVMVAEAGSEREAELLLRQHFAGKQTHVLVRPRE